MTTSKNYILLKIISLFLVTGIIVSACKKDDKDDVAQNYVDYYLYINEPSNIALNAVGGWKYIPAGTKGIIVYRRSQTEFTALERNCSFDPNVPASLVKVLSGISAIDSVCMSRFSIYDGSVINGPATQPLYQYQTYFDGTTLRIFN